MDGIFAEINQATQPEEMKEYIPRISPTLSRADAFETGDKTPLRVLSLGAFHPWIFVEERELTRSREKKMVAVYEDLPHSISSRLF